MRDLSGEIAAVNPRYADVLGYRCYASVDDLPDTMDCLVIAVPARAACDAMEHAFARGIRAAIVLASGFDDDDKNGPLGTRLKALAQQRHGDLRAQLLRHHQRQEPAP